jgi:hypothetical protein
VVGLWPTTGYVLGNLFGVGEVETQIVVSFSSLCLPPRWPHTVMNVDLGWTLVLGPDGSEQRAPYLTLFFRFSRSIDHDGPVAFVYKPAAAFRGLGFFRQFDTQNDTTTF